MFKVLVQVVAVPDRLRYFVLASNEEEAKIIKEYLENSIGFDRMRNAAGKKTRITKDERAVVSIVIAMPEYREIVMREKAKRSRKRTYVIRCIKMRSEDSEILEKMAREQGVSVSELIRRAVREFLHNHNGSPDRGDHA